ncbi:MAG: DUF3078 domain-containing protein [candidate division KSB1 bacterium]|nr:DUF3078 domain-containing protein [candidate division KSB1 bacterium]MDZ7346661.1 DUF3078 domain-containing protein [candidate division KSB1 bacterium]
MRKVTLILAAFSILPIVSAQEAQEAPKYGWQKEAVVSLNLTQASFDNYKQGGENSRAWQVRSTVKFVNDREKFLWANSGKFEYGNLKSGDKPVQKSVDEIKLESVLTYKVGKLLNPYLSAVGETQFAPGYDYSQSPKVKISQFMDPGTFREAMGLGYKPSDFFQIRLGAAAKQTLSRTFTSITDKPETEKIEKLKNEVGAESVIDLNYKLGGTTQLKSKLELFSNLKAFNKIDVIWDSDLTTKITKYIAFNFNVKLLYDRDVSAKRQLKQVMGLGISYSLF